MFLSIADATQEDSEDYFEYHFISENFVEMRFILYTTPFQRTFSSFSYEISS